MRRVAVIAPLLSVLLVATACGSEDSDELSSDERKAAQSLAAEFQGPGPSASRRDNGVCLGKELVRRAGVDLLVSSGMLTEDLEVNQDLPETVPDEIATAYADAYVACQDLRAELADVADFYPDLTDAQVDDYIACMDDVDDDLLRAAVIAQVTGEGEEAATAAWTEATKSCTDLLGAPGGDLPTP
ncbi:hypothetical protein [Nocardioides sp. AE5]|uniref:hypothetical protein n=1 Tax=Nocardioides sp. AE5 TaxID=2962573 RepID=UPI002882CC17|nr:hypothetical protein [Nocardioides sp. AE5]MDT0200399.1 hypothetical protein [Nocardioides sp. AE5]